MNKLKLICVALLLTIGISCDSSMKPECKWDDFCHQKNTKAITVINELNNFAQSIKCDNENLQIAKTVETIFEKIQDEEDLATIAGISRSFIVYESNSVPTCINSRSDQVYDHAFWICIKKLTVPQNARSKEYLRKLRDNSFLLQSQKQYFDEIAPPQ